MTNIEFHTLAAKIAAELGTGWSYTDTRHAGDDLYPWARISHVDGYSLSLGQTACRDEAKNRIAIHGNYAAYRDLSGRLATVRPSSTEEFRSIGSNEPEITVTAQKSRVAIAKDIKARLLPDYLPRYAATVKTAACWQECMDAKANMRETLDAIDGVRMGEQRDQDDPRGSVNVGPVRFGDIRVNGSTITLTLSGLSAAQVAAILDTLR